MKELKEAILKKLLSIQLVKRGAGKDHYSVSRFCTSRGFTGIYTSEIVDTFEDYDYDGVMISSSPVYAKFGIQDIVVGRYPHYSTGGETVEVFNYLGEKIVFTDNEKENCQKAIYG